MKTPSRVRVLVRLAVVGVTAASVATLAPANATVGGNGKFRLDPEVLSGRIAEFMLGESELDTRKATGGVSFGSNVRISDEHVKNALISQTEPAIAANPTDPKNLIAGFHDLFPQKQFACRIAFTADGGATWHLGGAVPLAATGHLCSDPGLAAGPTGTFFYSYLDVTSSAGQVEKGDVRVAISTDGGRTFPTSVMAVNGAQQTFFPDKEFIAADTSTSRFRGNLYLSFTEFKDPQDPKSTQNGQINVVVSRDGGFTWTGPTPLSANAFAPSAISGSDPVVAPNGDVYVFWAQFAQGVSVTNGVGGDLNIMFAKSTDGGFTWSAPLSAASHLPSPGRFRLRNADPNFGVVPGAGFRSNSFPSAAISPDGTIAVSWTDFPNGSCTADGTSRPPCANGDIRLATSGNGGANWSAPTTVNDDNGSADQFFSWIAFGPDGRLNLIWQDKRLDTGNVNFDTFYASSPNGSSFSKNVRVSTATSLTRTTTFIGDYNNLAVTSAGIFPVWTDRRFRNNDIFSATGM